MPRRRCAMLRPLTGSGPAASRRAHSSAPAGPTSVSNARNHHPALSNSRRAVSLRGLVPRPEQRDRPKPRRASTSVRSELIATWARGRSHRLASPWRTRAHAFPLRGRTSRGAYAEGAARAPSCAPVRRAPPHETECQRDCSHCGRVGVALGVAGSLPSAHGRLPSPRDRDLLRRRFPAYGIMSIDADPRPL
jgi:hypothetical protein